ncbi:hypothetical protein E4U54_002026 [Claviceps lovelessii]|nr:hypothetical protein E4U54_002026 [Claviceps lovelessii]
MVATDLSLFPYSRCGAEFCMICGVKWKKCDCPWFNQEDAAQGDYLDDIGANIPIPGIRGDLGDIFQEDGPPAPAELRGQAGFGYVTTMPVRTRPRTYHEEMHMRREQEVRDAELARRLQYNDNHYGALEPMGGGVGDIQGIGNASGHYMNETYRRGGGGGRHGRSFAPAQAQAQAQYDTADYENAFRSRGGKERRRAGRTSDSRSGMSSPTASGPIYPVGVLPPAPAPPPPPPPSPPPLVSAPPLGRRPRASRHHSLESDVYHESAPYSPRSGRVVSARMSRDYEHEVERHPPVHSRSRRRGRDRVVEDGATGSHLAGLSGTGSGKGRVSQWRTYVEPGVPDGESTVGHA